MRDIARAKTRLVTAITGLGLLSSLSGPAWAGPASIGTIFGTPHIGGKVTNGDLDEVRRDLTGHFDKPMMLRVDPASHGAEVMRIGLWLRDQQPAIRVRDTCVGACAWFMLDSGRSLQVAKDTVIAFGAYAELWSSIEIQLDRGDLTIDDDRSRDSIRSFKQRIPAAVWRDAAALREARLTKARAPAWVQDFVMSTTSLTVEQLARDEKDFNFRVLTSPHRCVWWVPDAEGMRQLGLSVPGYVPPDPARAATALRVPAKVIYIGPALPELPPTALCEGDPTLQLKLP
ncbi:MAG: hypothetical protein EOP37_10545 [Rubrivivax sp.]|nr:MAG: hypothetical protein EOP37_10545 [Rubrivivax sp.]